MADCIRGDTAPPAGPPSSPIEQPSGSNCEFDPEDVCCVGQGGTLFPAFSGEDEWDPAVRGLLYFLGMLFCFLGVAIVADLFMGGIEQICTATTVKTGKDGKKHVYRVWNPTVANLSLMALGSSAPEILLNVMEILFNDFYAGKLGPSTIVGSAAFNLMVIIAVCVISISKTGGDSGVRKIQGMKVYMITASCSVFAYLWLLVILAYWTKDVITIEEAVITFAMFWVLLFVAFCADKNFFFRPEADGDAVDTKEDARAKIAAEKMKDLKAKGIEGEKAAHVLQDLMKPTTPATYTREAMVMLTGKKKRAMIDPSGKPVNTGTTIMNLKKIVPISTPKVDSLAEPSSKGGLASIKFAEEAIACKEDCGYVVVKVALSRPCDEEVSVEYETQDVSAIANKDYAEATGTLKFEPGQLEAVIQIKILDDEKFENDEKFRVLIKGASPDHLAEVSKKGDIALVTILNEDGGGDLERLFAKLGNKDKFDFIMEEWKQQFSDAITPPSDGDGPPSKVGLIMHVFTVFWKVVFATVPPPALWGGWGAFAVALGYIAIMTVMVGDLCGLFGCIVGLRAEITAITFVALGTSMPDLFASKAAAVAEPDADNSVGNVTGSNCVNVFLGLGLPWMVASIYWTIQGEPPCEWFKKYSHLTEPGGSLHEYARDKKAVFVVESGNLGLSVVVFTCCSVTCLGTLAVRRMKLGAELGGPTVPKYVTAALFVFLWLLYVIISSLATMGDIDGEM